VSVPLDFHPARSYNRPLASEEGIAAFPCTGAGRLTDEGLVGRRLFVCVVIATAALIPMSGASAAVRHKPDPKPLWSAYPLNPRPVRTTQARGAVSSAAASRASAGAVLIGEHSSSTHVTALLVYVMGLAAVFVAILALQAAVPLGAPRRLLARHLARSARTPQRSSRSLPTRHASRPHTRPRPRPERRREPTLGLEWLRPQSKEPVVTSPGGAVTNTCTVIWWRGYMRSQFVATWVNAIGLPCVIAESPLFKYRGTVPPPQSEEAVEAHAALVSRLVAAGWQPRGRGYEWYEHWFVRSES
jgi:hypothetical protein